ncbi:MAG: hypothetical protein ABSB74_20335 [Tepidisphaeraceae bacterium]
MIGLLQGCADDGRVYDGGDMHLENSTQVVDSRVSEDGLLITRDFKTEGLTGHLVEVTLFDANNQCLAATNVTPKADDQPISDATLFIPASKLVNSTSNYVMNWFSTADEDRGHFLLKTQFTWNNFPSSNYKIIWEFVSCDDNFTTADGSPGVKIVLRLSLSGYKGHTFTESMWVTDPQMQNVSADQGGPITVDQGTITPGYDDTIYSDIEMVLPYSRLAAVPGTKELQITPCLREDTTWYAGNIHIRIWAGGQEDQVKAKLQEQIDDYNKQIADLDKRMSDLKKEIQP